MAAQEPAPLPEDRPRAGTVRSRLMLEAAAHMVSRPDWSLRQARVDLRVQGADGWPVQLFASDGPYAVRDVVEGRATFAILNPATAITAARRRVTDDDCLAAIATIPSYDQMGFAVPAALGITHLEELAQVRPALRVSLRGQRTHSVHQVVDDVLAAAGFSLEDMVAWGGTVTFQEGIPHRGERLEAMRTGAVDAVFDEGIYNWTPHATEAGLRFVGLGEGTLARLEAQGYRRAVLRRDRYPALHDDVDTVDFSGFLVYTRRDTAEELVVAFCEALLARRELMPWQGGAELPLERMLGDAVDAPVPLPLHPAARACWRRAGLR